MERGLKRLRTKYAGKRPASKPDSIDEKSWEIFSAYFDDGLSVKGIGAVAGLSPAQVSHALYEVDARLEATLRVEPEAKILTLESPIEDLPLSLRARNALHSLGCETLSDTLAIDLAGARGVGHKTLGEVRAALRSAGFPHPALDEPLETEIRSLNLSLDRIQDKITAALQAVAKEIAVVQKRIRKRMEPTASRDSRPVRGVVQNWPETTSRATSRDGEER